MADTKISAAGDAGVLISTDMVPLARSGNVNAFRATMSEVATFTSAAAPVQSVATRTGAVTLTHTDITDWAATLSPYALLASPTFTGTPTLPTGTVGVTQTAGTSNTSLATTAFVGTALGNYAPLAAPVFTGDARAVTATAGDNDTSIATTAFVQTALISGVPNANVVDNSGFAINQRGQTSGTALASGAYGHDRWKGGASGCTYTFTQSGGPATTITITAGSLQQVIEGAALSSGSYTLSWTGTAQGRTGAGSYAVSPVAVTATVGTNLTIEFNTGTLGQVKLEPGTVRTAWTANMPRYDLANCQRFYQTVMVWGRAIATGAGNHLTVPVQFPPMRAVPTITISSGGSSGNISGATLATGTNSSAYYDVTALAAGDFYAVNAVYTLSADL